MRAALSCVTTLEESGDLKGGKLQPLAAIFGLGPLEVVIIISVIVVLFLPALLPKIAKRLGETVTTLKDMTNKAIDEGEEDGDGSTK